MTWALNAHATPPRRHSTAPPLQHGVLVHRSIDNRVEAHRPHTRCRQPWCRNQMQAIGPDLASDRGGTGHNGGNVPVSVPLRC